MKILVVRRLDYNLSVMCNKSETIGKILTIFEY
jgi:hypothetical protein